VKAENIFNNNIYH